MRWKRWKNTASYCYNAWTAQQEIKEKTKKDIFSSLLSESKEMKNM